jgi:hypothetical protein
MSTEGLRALLWIRRTGLRWALDAPEEPRDGRIECRGDFHQSRNTQTIRTDFIFLDLLRGNTYYLGKLMLRHAEHLPALPDPPSNRLVDWSGFPRLHAMGALDTRLH